MNIFALFKYIITSCRTILALGHLVMTCDQVLYIKLIDSLMAELENSSTNGANGVNDNNVNSRTYIQAIGAMCRQAGHR